LAFSGVQHRSLSSRHIAVACLGRGLLS